MWQVISMALALFVVIILVIIFSTKYFQTRNMNTECENNAGECILPEKCPTCSNQIDCNVKYPFPCEGKKICCPQGDRVNKDDEKDEEES